MRSHIQRFGFALIGAGVFASALGSAQIQDSTPPAVVSYSFAPSIDTRNGTASLTVNFDVSDDLAGATSFSLSFRHDASGQYALGHASFQPSLTHNGSLVVSFPQFCAAGVWRVDWVQAGDAVGNMNLLGRDKLAALGLSAQIEVVSDEDVLPPELVSYKYPASIDVTEGSASRRWSTR